MEGRLGQNQLIDLSKLYPDIPFGDRPQYRLKEAEGIDVIIQKTPEWSSVTHYCDTISTEDINIAPSLLDSLETVDGRLFGRTDFRGPMMSVTREKILETAGFEPAEPEKVNIQNKDNVSNMRYTYQHLNDENLFLSLQVSTSVPHVGIMLSNEIKWNDQLLTFIFSFTDEARREEVDIPQLVKELNIVTQ